MPSHYLSQCWNIVNWTLRNNLQCNFTWKSYMKMHLKMAFVKWQPFCLSLHDDFIKWKHFPRYWPFVGGIHRSPVNSPLKGQRPGALMFSLICVWINGSINDREAGDLTRHHVHYDVTVMQCVKDMDIIDWYLTSTKQFKAQVVRKLFGYIVFKQKNSHKRTSVQ